MVTKFFNYATSMEDLPPLWSDVTKAAKGNGSDDIFNDIEDHWAKKEIEFMAANGYVNGLGDNKFSANAKIPFSDSNQYLNKQLNC